MSILAARDGLFVTGGGTAGHIYAGIAIADRWRELNPRSEIDFVGARGGMEERLVARTSYRLHLVPMGAWNGMSPIRRLKTLLQIPWSFSMALVLLFQKRPRAVVGVGGYASFPLVLAAAFTGWLWGCRVAILEQNVLPGLTNRVLGRFARRIFTAFPGSETVFGAAKVMVTGNPIRSSMKRLPPASGRPFTIFVFGGSQGAVGINTLVVEALPALQASGLPIRIIHQTGEKDHERVSQAYQSLRSAAGAIEARVEKFIYEMPEVYGQADVLVCRAGSSTLAEIAAVGRAAILIPLVSRDRHQVHNAEYFAREGAARILIQGETNGEQLARALVELANKPEELRAIEKKVVSFSRPDAVQQIVSDLSPVGGSS
jgi:UDP-N-acetylglucosamine--N-acetylmuramyl-(pentapeptide) pyrophosphoryl-undecaprenol N-acetylglucosamine transferase